MSVPNQRTVEELEKENAILLRALYQQMRSQVNYTEADFINRVEAPESLEDIIAVLKGELAEDTSGVS